MILSLDIAFKFFTKSPVRNSQKLHLLIPLDEIEPEALNQVQAALNREFIKELAIMPDIHAGYDLPIGSAALTENIISPSFVGYDIGCGMCQVKLPGTTHELIPDEREAVSIHNQIRKIIPVGFSSNKKPQDYTSFVSSSGDKKLSTSVNKKLKEQLGTLGGGNHFIEIGENKSREVFITIHSGSRNSGHQIAEYYMKIAKYMDINSDHGKAYYKDMLFMQNYALDNRLRMVEKIVIEALGYSLSDWEKAILPTLINENHNHAIKTSEGILHRKGATPAEKGQMGVIPGNMRDGVYITRGLGNREFLSSASHGAGRSMSRTKARETLKMYDFQETMEGIAADVSRHTLDEAPMAYKDLNMVISRQKGIVVDIVDHVKPLINVKG